VGGEREPLAPRTTISKINIFSDGGLGLSDMDKRRVRRAVAFAISAILRSNVSLCLEPPERVRLAVSYLEERVPVLASCDGSWGACAALSRSLYYRQQHEARKRKRLGDDADAAPGNTEAAAEEGAGSGLPSEEQTQHDSLSQLP